MIIYEERQSTVKSLISVQCDKCKKKFKRDDDVLEIQEFHHIGFTGGYASVFGDGDIIECDLCQNCLKELIGNYYRTVELFYDT